MSRSKPSRYFKFENADEAPYLVLGRCQKGAKAIARQQGRRVDGDTRISDFTVTGNPPAIINPRGTKS